MSQLIAQHLNLIEKSKQGNEINVPFDAIHEDLRTELKRLQSLNSDDFRTDLNQVSKYLTECFNGVSDTLLADLNEYYMQLLQKWRQSAHPLDVVDIDNIRNLSIINQNEDTNLTKSQLDELIECLRAIARNGKDMFTSSSISAIKNLLCSCINLATDNYSSFITTSPVIDSVFECLCSPYSLEVMAQFKSTVTIEERTEAEQFLFDGLFRFVERMQGAELIKRAVDLRRHFLQSISGLLDTLAVSFDTCSISAMCIMEILTTIFLYMVDMTLPNDIHIDIQIHMCSTAIEILSSTCQSVTVKKNCIQYIYLGTLNDKIIDQLKSPKLTADLFQFIRTYEDQHEIQFNCYRALAALMTEEDIKRLNNPSAIAAVFIRELENLMNRKEWEVRFLSILTTIKSKTKYFLSLYHKK
jgi:hypothetical protein